PYVYLCQYCHFVTIHNSSSSCFFTFFYLMTLLPPTSTLFPYTTLFRSPLHKPLPVEDEVLILYALTHGFLDAIPVPDIQRYELELYDYFASNYNDLLDVIRTTGDLPEEDKLNEALKNFNEGFSISKK